MTLSSIDEGFPFWTKLHRSTMMAGVALLWTAMVVMVRASRVFDIRVADGVDRQPSPPASETNAFGQKPRREPAAAYGPSIMLGMTDTCLTAVQGSYDYTLCLFSNVTQKRTSERFKINIGIWGRWQRLGGPEEGKAAYSYAMRYYDGDACVGNVSRSATIHVLCGSDDLRLEHVREPQTCAYSMDLQVPVPCHLLEADLRALPAMPPPASSTTPSDELLSSARGTTEDSAPVTTDQRGEGSCNVDGTCAAVDTSATTILHAAGSATDNVQTRGEAGAECRRFIDEIDALQRQLEESRKEVKRLADLVREYEMYRDKVRP